MSNDYLKGNLLRHTRAEGYYRRDASLGKVDGAWKTFVQENKDRDALTMDQEPRNMYAGGQLVRNTDNGSRPGYAGKPYLDQKKFIEEFTKQRIDGNKTTTEFVKYLNDNYKPSAQTDKFNIGNVDRRMRVLQEKGLIPTDIVTKGSKADLALTPEKYKSVLGEKEYNRIMKEDPTKLKYRYEYVRDKKNNPDFLDIRKERTKNWKASLTPDELREKVTNPALEYKQKKFPTKFTVYRDSARSLAWKDLVSRTYEYDISKEKSKGTPYFEFETPIESGKNYNTADMKEIVLVDQKGNKFTYDTLFDDVEKVAGEVEASNFKNTYEQRAFMNKDGITKELNNLYDIKPGSYKSLFNVQHIEGFNKNPFKIHMTFATQNAAENKARRIFTDQFGKASKIPLDGKGNKGARFLAQKAAINNYYKSLGPDIVAQISKKPYGATKPLMELLNLTPIKLTDSQTKGVTAIDNDIKKRLTTISKGGGSKAKAATKALAILAGSTGAAVADDGSEGTSGMLTDAAIAGGAVATVGTKAGRKLLGNLFNAAGLPASIAFNYFAGIDANSSLDRTILGAELATAPSLIQSAIKVTDKIKNPLLKKTAQVATTINPYYAAKVARAVQPVGIATLGGELAYKIATESNPNMLRDKQGNALFDVNKADTLFSNMLMQSDKKFLPENQYKKQYGDKNPDLPELFIEKLKND